jgi:hypothetical protein
MVHESRLLCVNDDKQVKLWKRKKRFPLNFFSAYKNREKFDVAPRKEAIYMMNEENNAFPETQIL